MTLNPQITQCLERDLNGFIVIVTQQYDTHEVLILDRMNEEAFNRTLDSGRVIFWSYSRREY